MKAAVCVSTCTRAKTVALEADASATTEKPVFINSSIYKNRVDVKRKKSFSLLKA